MTTSSAGGRVAGPSPLPADGRSRSDCYCGGDCLGEAPDVRTPIIHLPFGCGSWWIATGELAVLAAYPRCESHGAGVCSRALDCIHAFMPAPGVSHHARRAALDSGAGSTDAP